MERASLTVLNIQQSAPLWVASFRVSSIETYVLAKNVYYPQRPARVARSVAYLMLRMSSKQHNRFTSMMQCTKCEKGSGSDFEIASCEDARLDQGCICQVPQVSMQERWSTCLMSMKQHDEKMVNRWMGEIDSLLVFAGLFFGVLTAFIIEFYRQLQSDPEILLLQQLSFQLASLEAPDLDLLLHSPPFSYTPSNQVVRMNAAWLSALLCSLFVALTGILAKQWLHEYISELPSCPRERVRIGQLRYDGLRKWRLEEIIRSLPILLEVALLLFIYGLLELLWTLNSTIAIICTVIVALSQLFSLATLVMPAFSPDCPFKTPQAWCIFKLAWRLLSLRRFFHKSSPSNLSFGFPASELALPSTWMDREIEYGRVQESELDGRALSRAFKQSLDEDFLDKIALCVNDLRVDVAVSLVFELLARRCECTVEKLLESIRSPGTIFPLERLSLKAGRRLRRGTHRLLSMFLGILPRMLHNCGLSQITILDLLTTLRKILRESELAACKSRIHRQALDTLTSLMNPQCPFQVQQLCLEILEEMIRLSCNMNYCPAGALLPLLIRYLKITASASLDIQNLLFCARDARLRGDQRTFVRASGILLDRLSVIASPSADVLQQRKLQELNELLKCWVRDLGRYFREQNRKQIKFGVGVHVKWCSGFVAVAKKDRKLVPVELTTKLEAGENRGSVDSNSEERDAFERLKLLYVDAQPWIKKIEDLEYESDLDISDPIINHG